MEILYLPLPKAKASPPPPPTHTHTLHDSKTYCCAKTEGPKTKDPKIQRQGAQAQPFKGNIFSNKRGVITEPLGLSCEPFSAGDEDILAGVVFARSFFASLLGVTCGSAFWERSRCVAHNFICLIPGNKPGATWGPPNLGGSNPDKKSDRPKYDRAVLRSRSQREE